MKKYLLLAALVASSSVMAAPNIYGGMSFQNTSSDGMNTNMPALNIGVEVMLTDTTSVSIETGYERLIDDSKGGVVNVDGGNREANILTVVQNIPLIAKYNFSIDDNWTVSPLAGIAYTFGDVDLHLKKPRKTISKSDSAIGGVVGLETSYKVRDDLSLNLGYKFTRSDLSGVNSEYKTLYAGFNFHF